jgi:uncharacterized protein (TIGR04255 family)
MVALYWYTVRCHGSRLSDSRCEYYDEPPYHTDASSIPEEPVYLVLRTGKGLARHHTVPFLVTVEDMGNVGESLRRPFRTPLFEVVAEIDLALEGLVELRAQSLHDALVDEYPTVQRLSVLLVADTSTIQNAHAPAYRFYNADGRRIVQVGPRMISLNTLTWESGYENYRDAAYRVMDAYCKTTPRAPVYRYHLGFYNRIASADLEEAQQLVRFPFAVNPETAYRELAWQSVQNTDVGSILMQFGVAPPDERTPESYLSVVNTVRYELPTVTSFEAAIDGWRTWFDQAHEKARQIFWESLMPAAQKSWVENDPK